MILITLAALGALVGWFARNPTRPGLWLAVGLLTGGALGNLADRIRDGAVTDFIDPPRWPAFNFADVAITIGVLLVVLAYMRPARARDRPRGRRPRCRRQARRASSSTRRRAPAARRWSTCSTDLAGGEDGAPGHRPPPRQGHLRPDGRRPQRGGPRGPGASRSSAREVGREYLALVEGRLASRDGTIDAPIGRSHRDPTRMAVAGRAQREARTHFEVIELLRGRHPCPRPPRDRPHPPDPRPLRRDRPPGCRRPHLRHRRPPRPGPPVPPLAPAQLPSIPGAERRSSSNRRCPETSRSRWSERRAEPSDPRALQSTAHSRTTTPP